MRSDNFHVIILQLFCRSLELYWPVLWPFTNARRTSTKLCDLQHTSHIRTIREPLLHVCLPLRAIVVKAF